jgi:hypothetical protein
VAPSAIKSDATYVSTNKETGANYAYLLTAPGAVK